MGKDFGFRDPFDDPFFTQPFRAFFDWNGYDGSQSSISNSTKPISIEEIKSNGDGARATDPTTQQVVAKQPKQKSANNRGVGGQSYSYRRVAYGGLDGWYYSCSEGRMTGGDGVFLAEIKEDDKIIGQSLHTVSKGIHEKGQSVTTKKDSNNGNVDTLQTLHNLNEDELPGFEENWKTSADKYLPAWNNGFNLLEDAGHDKRDKDGFPGWGGWGGWPFPSIEHIGNDGAVEPYGQPSDAAKERRIVPVE